MVALETPLGKDTLALTSFAGEERLSGLFIFDLKIISDKPCIKPDQLVGKPVDFHVRYQDEELRYFNEYVNRFTYAGRGNRAHMYRAHSRCTLVVVPA